jgi:hypothetical protein
MKVFLPIAITLILFTLVFTVLSTKESKHYEIVVAKYNEDISWTRPYRYVKIYDKSKGDLPNIGRESHTYLTYIVENYENLPDVVFFTQGRFSDHYNTDPDYFINIQDKYSGNTGFLKSDYYFYSEKTREYSNNHIDVYRGNKIYKSELGFTDWFKTHIDTDNTHNIDEHVVWWPNAIFSVSRECILSRPKEYYKNLLNLIPNNSNPEVGHYFERSWFYIFNCHK